MARGILLAGVVTLLSFAPAASAGQDYVGRTPPVVQGTEFTRAAPTPAPVAPAVLAQEADPDDRIPITGGDIAGLTLIGVGAIAAGTALTRRARRHA